MVESQIYRIGYGVLERWGNDGNVRAAKPIDKTRGLVKTSVTLGAMETMGTCEPRSREAAERAHVTIV